VPLPDSDDEDDVNHAPRVNAGTEESVQQVRSRRRQYLPNEHSKFYTHV
jgi:hypothetical protein